MTDTKAAAGALCRGEYWQQVILSRVEIARADLARNAGPPGDPLRDRVEALLQTAADSAAKPGFWLWQWLFGGAINQAFVNLHAAQVLLARIEPTQHLDVRLGAAMARMRSSVPAGPRLSYLDNHLRIARADVDVKRLLLERALEWSYGATDAQYARLRSFRNIITIVSVVVILLLAALAIMGAADPQSLNLCFRPDPNGPQVCPLGASASRGDALVIEMLGAAGGALAAVFTVSGLYGTSAPYGVPIALAMLKLPVGALTGLIGLVLVHGRFVPGLEDLDTSGQILAYAVVFGIAQHAVTSFVDRRGHQILADLPAKQSGAVRRNGRSR